MKLPQQFYTGDDVLQITRQLLGKYVFTQIDGVLTGGYITEAEAYNGVVDKASHAFGGKITPRTKTMYSEGGIAYIYLCYGIHEMFNIVTSAEGQPHAVLIRGIQPTHGIETMLARRKMEKVKPNLTVGPGSVAKALGIDRRLNGTSLQSDELWLEDRGLIVDDAKISTGPRIGVDYAGDDALLPYRYILKA